MSELADRLMTEVRRLRYRAQETIGLWTEVTDAGTQMVATADALEAMAAEIRTPVRERGDERQVLPEGWRVSIERGMPGVMWLELRGPQCSSSNQANPRDDVQWRIFERFETALSAHTQAGPVD